MPITDAGTVWLAISAHVSGIGLMLLPPPCWLPEKSLTFLPGSEESCPPPQALNRKPVLHSSACSIFLFIVFIMTPFSCCLRALLNAGVTDLAVCACARLYDMCAYPTSIEKKSMFLILIAN
ncbi:hypothetical protein V8J88_09450 [Massilia sp. W12]|uniref:hypothetical protein n=1 Tax=Massilia sp. W12 TaxID=3126507 RepID=UPI0030D27CF3